MGEAMRRWSEREWDHCLYSFYRNDAKVEAIQSFKKKYPDRTENAIRSKFFHEKINVETYLGSGLGRNKATKQQLIQELKHIYKILGEPFNKKQFTEISETTYETLVGYFGSWEAAIRESGLTNKFDNFTDVAKEIKEFKPEEEIQKNWKKVELIYISMKKIKIFTHDCKTGGTTKNAVGDDYCTAVVAMSVITIRLISIAFSLLLYD